MALFDNRCRKISTIASLSVVSFFSILPAQAATLAESQGGFSFTNFSVTPLSTNSSARTSTLTTGSGAFAIANADALFELLPNAEAVNVISNSAFTSGAFGSALAESNAAVIGDFAIGAGETFTFDFSGFIDLLTFTEQPTDFATAALETQYSIFGFDADTSTSTELDFLNLFGEINTPSGADSAEVNNSSAITFDIFDITDDTGATKISEAISIQVSGSYKRFFNKTTTLTLAELKAGAAFSESQASTDIPESSSPMVWLLGVGSAIVLSRKQKILSALSGQAAPKFS